MCSLVMLTLGGSVDVHNRFPANVAVNFQNMLISKKDNKHRWREAMK